jgi:hypothetical protein
MDHGGLFLRTSGFQNHFFNVPAVSAQNEPESKTPQKWSRSTFDTRDFIDQLKKPYHDKVNSILCVNDSVYWMRNVDGFSPSLF